MTEDAIARLDKDKQKAISAGKLKIVAEICDYKGQHFFRIGEYGKALEEHEEQFQASQATENMLGVSIAHRRIGECLVELGQFEQALYHHQQYLQLASAWCFDIEEQRAWATLGRTLYLKEMSLPPEDRKKHSLYLQKAEQAFLNALQHTEKIKDHISKTEFIEMRAKALLNLGHVYEEQDDVARCAKNLQQAIYLAKKHNLREDLCRCQLSLGALYLRHGELTPSLRSLDEAINSAKTLCDISLVCEPLLAKAEVLVRLKDFQGARYYFKKAYKLHCPASHDKAMRSLKIVMALCQLQADLQATEADNYSKLMEVYEKLGDACAALDIFKTAIEYYKLMLNSAKLLGKSNKELAAIYFSLAQTYADDKQYGKALSFFWKEFVCHKDNPNEQCCTMLKIADIQENQNCTEEALKSYVKALEFASIAGNKNLMVRCKKHLQQVNDSAKFLGSVDTLQELRHIIDDSQLDSEGDQVSEDEEEHDSEALWDSMDLDNLSDSSGSECESVQADVKQPRRRTRQAAVKVNEVGESPLHKACISGNLKLVQMLIEQGHPVNPRDYCGWLPLHEAANHGFCDIVEHLLDHGAWINDCGGDECDKITPLHDAASCGHLDVVKLLMKRGANLLAVTDEKETPLDSLIHFKQRVESELDEDMLQDILLLEAELRKAMAENSTGLHHICEDPASEVVEVRHVPLSTKTEAANGALLPSLVSTNQHLQHVTSRETTDQPALLNAADSTAWLEDDIPRRPVKLTLVREKRQKSRLNRSPCRKGGRVCDGRIAKVARQAQYLSATNCKRPCMDSSSDEDHQGEDSLESCSQPLVEDSQHPSVPKPDVIQPSLKIHQFHIRLNGSLLTIPSDVRTSTVGQLAIRAAEEYSTLAGVKNPFITLYYFDGKPIPLQESVHTILKCEELLGEVEDWDSFSMVMKYKTACEKFGTLPYNEVATAWEDCQVTGVFKLSNGRLPLGQLSAIQQCLQNSHLTSLAITGCSIDNEGIRILAAALPTISSLRKLYLGSCAIRHDGLRHLVRYFTVPAPVSPKGELPRNLEVLDLSFNSLGPESSSHLACLLAALPSLATLILSGCDLNSALGVWCPELCHSFRGCQNLQDLNISYNQLGEDGISALLESVCFTPLMKLDISNTVSSENHNIGKSLARFLRQETCQLSHLVIRGCYLSEKDINELQRGLICSKYLQQLDLGSNPNISVYTISALVENSPSLTSVWLPGCLDWTNTTSLSEMCRLMTSGRLHHLTLTTERMQPDNLDKMCEAWYSAWDWKGICKIDRGYISYTLRPACEM